MTKVYKIYYFEVNKKKGRKIPIIEDSCNHSFVFTVFK